MKLIEDNALIGGGWGSAADSKRFAVLNPADGSELATVPDCGAPSGQAMNWVVPVAPLLSRDLL